MQWQGGGSLLGIVKGDESEGTDTSQRAVGKVIKNKSDRESSLGVSVEKAKTQPVIPH